MGPHLTMAICDRPSGSRCTSTNAPPTMRPFDSKSRGSGETPGHRIEAKANNCSWHMPSKPEITRSHSAPVTLRVASAGRSLRACLCGTAEDGSMLNPAIVDMAALPARGIQPEASLSRCANPYPRRTNAANLRPWLPKAIAVRTGRPRISAQQPLQHAACR